MSSPGTDVGANERQGSSGAMSAWRRALELISPIEPSGHTTLPAVVENLARRTGDSVALVSERQSLTYRELSERSNRYSRWALAQGLRQGDVVALMMTNSVDYLAIWLGMTRVGIIVALINTNLREDTLAHSIDLVTPKLMIVGGDLTGVLKSIMSGIGHQLEVGAHGDGDHRLLRIDRAAAIFSGAPLGDSEYVRPLLKQPALYIYTSGTTGLPKAAVISHLRVMQWGHWFAGMIGVDAGDRMYDCLPMYHSVGGVVAPGAMLIGGGSLAIREKFSASEFWDDIKRWDCTLFQYIGELCRYLLKRPRHRHETEHSLRLCCGNGLRGDIWSEFQRRFRIPQILEFYAATEGSFSLYNVEGKPGAIGRIPPFLRHRFPVAIVKTEDDGGDPMRDENGFCVRCIPGEVGEAIGKLSPGPCRPGAVFEGYTDKTASERKVLRDVFVRGDAWFRSGDLMRYDDKGYFYFADRLGDTFRWKGENVSTTEVEAVIAACPGVCQSVVYGVDVPHTDGRAGMAAIVTDERFDLARLERLLAEQLPEYARPVFLRQCQEIPCTATFKPQKSRLVKDGFDPAASRGPVQFRPQAEASFVRLDAAAYRAIQKAGLVRDRSNADRTVGAMGAPEG